MDGGLSPTHRSHSAQAETLEWNAALQADKNFGIVLEESLIPKRGPETSSCMKKTTSSHIIYRSN